MCLVPSSTTLTGTVGRRARICRHLPLLTADNLFELLKHFELVLGRLDIIDTVRGVNAHGVHDNDTLTLPAGFVPKLAALAKRCSLFDRHSCGQNGTILHNVQLVEQRLSLGADILALFVLLLLDLAHSLLFPIFQGPEVEASQSVVVFGAFWCGQDLETGNVSNGDDVVVAGKGVERGTRVWGCGCTIQGEETKRGIGGEDDALVGFGVR